MMGPIAEQKMYDMRVWRERSCEIDRDVAAFLLEVLVGAGFSGKEIWKMMSDRGIYIPQYRSFSEGDYHYDCRPRAKAPGGCVGLKARVGCDMESMGEGPCVVDRDFVLRFLGKEVRGVE